MATTLPNYLVEDGRDGSTGPSGVQAGKLGLKMRAKASIWLLALLILGACHTRPTSATTAEEAVRAANLYRAEKYPQARSSDYDIVTDDLGDRWRVTYRSIEGGTGGGSTLEVDKGSARIVYEGGGQ